MALMKNGSFNGLEGLLGFFQDVDLVMTEGYKQESKPKIEVFRSEAHEKPVCFDHKDLVALVSDVVLETRVPRFGLEDIEDLATFIEKKFITPEPTRKENP
jgi:molybdopterin-guanine dinucleotide biosynthesis protein MobB